MAASSSVESLSIFVRPMLAPLPYTGLMSSSHWLAVCYMLCDWLKIVYRPGRGSSSYSLYRDRVMAANTVGPPAQAMSNSSKLLNPSGAKSLIVFTVLALAWLAGFSSRLFAVIRFESIIHEFDPWQDMIVSPVCFLSSIVVLLFHYRVDMTKKEPNIN